MKEIVKKKEGNESELEMKEENVREVRTDIKVCLREEELSVEV